MSSLSFSFATKFSLSSSTASTSAARFSGILFGPREKRLHFCTRRSNFSCSSKPRAQDLLRNGLPVTKWHELVDYDTEDEEANLKFSTPSRIRACLDAVKTMLTSMEDGEISISAYDTAWVALVEHVDENGNKRPVFPTTLEWIASNQLEDGSWGDDKLFLAFDRLLNTLACVIALKSWDLHHDKCEKGLKFFNDNLDKLADENQTHMPIGFEVAFFSVLDKARELNINVPYDSPSLKDYYTLRDIKLKKIPKEILHKVPTTLLHSLEGMADLDWENLMKLQSSDGSFLFSPSSTAFALMQTKDENCFNYLRNIVDRFEGGVPNVYPIDMFEHIWAIDRLERLGVSRFFEDEINECVEYIYRHWSDDGICWARNTKVQDIDDTAMAFRILRLHGYQISADVFKNFEKDGEFVCFSGQSNQAVTGMFNLLRASQVSYPDEDILHHAHQFSSNYLALKQESNQLFDKWIITKDLPGEIGYALEIPYYASLPRVETRFYIEQYGGEDDVWIGKTLYRMPYVNNDVYLKLAKMDYNNCQALHQIEWENMQSWYTDCKLDAYGISKREVLVHYFVAASTIFEIKRSQERLAWAKTRVLMEAISSYFKCSHSKDVRTKFIERFEYAANLCGSTKRRKSGRNKKQERTLIGTLLQTINHLSWEALMNHDRPISHTLHLLWANWMKEFNEGDTRQIGDAELLLEVMNQCSIHSVSNNLLTHPQYQSITTLANSICYKLGGIYDPKLKDRDESIQREIDGQMQQLLEMMFQKSDEGVVDSHGRRTILSIVKACYYTACCDMQTIDSHISKVLFESVV